VNQWSVDQRACAKSLFGRALRVALALWISERGPTSFFQLEAQRAMFEMLGESASGVTKELDLLTRLGLLSRDATGHRVYYSRLDSALWVPLVEAGRAVARMREGDSPPIEPERSSVSLA